MSSTCLTVYQSETSLSLPRNTGVSEEAKTLQDRVRDVISSLFQTETLGEPLREGLETLEQAAEEASLPNWDGYEAQPVTELGYYKAKQFLESLPRWLAVPEIGVDPDGEISFDWYSKPNNVFSVSVSETGKLTYAGTFGLSKVHGIEYFGDEIPRSILINLQRLWNEELNY